MTTDLPTVLRITGLTVDALLRLERPSFSPEQCLAIGVQNPEWYLRAFKYGYEIGDQFFPRTPPSGDYLLGWNHGREARSGGDSRH